MPAFRWYYLKNNSSITVVATTTPSGASAVSVSPPIVPGQSARVDLNPMSPKDEMHNLGLGVVAESSTTAASAGSFYTYEPGSGETLYTICSGGGDSLSLDFDGYGPDPAPPQPATGASK